MRDPEDVPDRAMDRLQDLADDVTMEAPAMNGIVQGAEAVHAIVDYTAKVRGEPIRVAPRRWRAPGGFLFGDRRVHAEYAPASMSSMSAGPAGDQPRSSLVTVLVAVRSMLKKVPIHPK